MKKVLYLLLPLAIIAASGCGKSFSGAQKYLTGPVDGVGLKKSTSIVEGGVEQLFAVVTPAKTSNKRVTWSSSDSTIASVDSSGTVMANKVGAAVITAVTEEGKFSASCDVTVAVKPVPVTGLTLNKNTSVMLIGNAEQLIVDISPRTATNQNLTWSSSDDGIASVDQSGLVTGRTSGSAVITVTSSDGGFTSSCVFTVASVPVYISGLAMNKSATTVVVGKSETLFGVITPSTATDQVLLWSSSNEGVATVGRYSGVVTGVSVGTATITATSSYTTGGTDITTAAAVSVVASEVPVTGITLSKSSMIIDAGSSETISATVSPVGATGQSLLWTSSKSAIASVCSDGTVTGVSAGSAVITASTVDGSIKATCSILVKAANIAVTGVSLNKSSTTIQAGTSETLFALLEPSLASNQNVTWSSSTSNATVSDGKVTGVSAGSATITVTTADGGKTATCECTITAAAVPVSDLSLSADPSGIKVGNSVKMTASITPSTATNQNLIWVSLSPAVATVNAAGVVTGVANGTAIIKANATDGSGCSATCTVTVTVPVTAVKIYTNDSSATVTSAAVNGGFTLQLNAGFTPSAPSDTRVTWTSTNSAIATVGSTTGLVTPVAPGKVTIKVTTTDGGFSAYCVVTVNGCTLTYNANGATGDTPDAVSTLSGGTVNLSTTTLSLTHYNFAGWKIGSTVYKAGIPVQLTGNITAYARWTPVPVYASAGNAHSAIVAYDGTVWTAGDNDYGQLGDGTTNQRTTWVQVMQSAGVPFKDAASVCASERHTMIIKTDGTVWAMGANDAGQLCIGEAISSDSHCYPVQSTALSDVKFISSRTCQDLFLKNNSQLWGGGKNAYGELGQGLSVSSYITPLQLIAGAFISVAAGRMHSAVVSASGAVWTTGSNAHGELGNGGTSSTSAFSLIYTSGAKSVAAGFWHTMVLLTDGSILGTGYNAQGQLGNGSTTSTSTLTSVLSNGAQAIACGQQYSMYISTGNTLYAAGDNGSGQFGNGTTTSATSWTHIMDGVASVYPGNDSTFILKTDGTLWATGGNYYGNLGNGTTDSTSTPFQVILP